ITGFQPIINGPAIGYSNAATILLKIKLTTIEEKNLFIKKLTNISPIVHIATTIGKYDLQLAILYKNTEQLYKIIEEIKILIPNFIIEYEILQIVEEPKFEDVESLVLNDI
ncbi:MAG: hypothetical protein KC550_04380, partial [Nanoarchaeota archaeon]|nr:hypothetical protein [Nanoarchaeota archaeon]